MAGGDLGKTYHDGEVIIRRGEVGDCMFVIQAGRVEVLVEEGGRQRRLAVLGEGDFFGEMAIFEREVRSATVRALGEVRAVTVDKRSLLRRISEDPSVAFRMVQTLSQRIREMDTRMSAGKAPADEPEALPDGQGGE